MKLKTYIWDNMGPHVENHLDFDTMRKVVILDICSIYDGISYEDNKKVRKPDPSISLEEAVAQAKKILDEGRVGYEAYMCEFKPSELMKNFHKKISERLLEDMHWYSMHFD